MAQAIVDPADLRRFAQQLKKFSDQLQGEMQSLRSRLQTLGSSWRDQENQKFVEEFEATMVVLNRFVAASETHVPFLMRKAERIEEYINQR
jgi:WXG100 family type VII secretion target